MRKYIAWLILVFLLAGCSPAPAETQPVTEPVPETEVTVPAAALEAEAAVLVEEVPPPTGIVLEPEVRIIRG